VLHSLSDAVRFYAERDTQPQKWYPRLGDGSTSKFDDLPPEYVVNLDSQAPFDRHPGEPPAMSEDDIQDIVVFLRTLSDGYQ
jgi:cytochrome c peroxidase